MLLSRWGHVSPSRSKDPTQRRCGSVRGVSWAIWGLRGKVRLTTQVHFVAPKGLALCSDSHNPPILTSQTPRCHPGFLTWDSTPAPGWGGHPLPSAVVPSLPARPPGSVPRVPQGHLHS